MLRGTPFSVWQPQSSGEALALLLARLALGSGLTLVAERANLVLGGSLVNLYGFAELANLLEFAGLAELPNLGEFADLANRVAPAGRALLSGADSDSSSAKCKNANEASDRGTL